MPCVWIKAHFCHVTALNRLRPLFPPVRLRLSLLVRLLIKNGLPSTVTDHVPIDRNALMIDNLKWELGNV